MIAEEMKEYCYSFSDMCRMLQLKESTLRRRLYLRSNVPPFQKEGKEFWFPRELFAAWVKSRRIEFEVSDAS